MYEQSLLCELAQALNKIYHAWRRSLEYVGAGLSSPGRHKRAILHCICLTSGVLIYAVSL
jgi:hypothetical protein